MKLSEVANFSQEKISINKILLENYISTENMLQNKEGICISSSIPTISKATSFKKNDILISNIRPYFKKIWLAQFSGGCSNDILVIRAKNNYNYKFLYYVLSSDNFFNYATATSKGTKMPRGDKEAIMDYSVPDFKIDIQKKIGDFLYNLDKKILINKEINDNLAQQIQNIYNELFVTNAKSSWQRCHLCDLIKVKYGKDHRKLADGIYPVFGSGGFMRKVDRPLYERESVLIPRKGSLNNIMYVNEPFWSVDTMFYTEMKLPNIAKFIYHFIKSLDLASMNAGSAVPSMTVDILNSIELFKPDNKSLEFFESIASKIYLKIFSNSKESENLSELRDLLLPKLISGELDISEIKF